MLLCHARTTLLALFAVALALALAVVSAGAAEASGFSDTSGISAEDAVDALADEGVVRGCAEGEFCPRQPLTRAQMATVLVAAIDLSTVETAAFGDEGLFADVVGNVHADSINTLAAAGITQGCGDDEFCPSELVTRGQLATMLSEAFEVEASDVDFFDDSGDIHGDAINRLAALGAVAGCGEPLTAYCPNEPVLRAHAASFMARVMGLVDRVELTSLEDRRAEQVRIDAERKAQAEAEAKARAEAEAKAKAEAQAKAEAEANASRVAVWDRVARCESNGNWGINTGNGYYGGLQFSLGSWRAVGGSGYPHQASKSEQIRRAEMLLKRQGWGAWPACSRKLGLR